MRWDCDWKERWHPWFAWYPVKVADHDCRWLELVERRRKFVWLKYACTGWFEWEYNGRP